MSGKNARKHTRFSIRKFGVLLLAVMMMAITIPVQAAPKIRVIDYEGQGNVEVKFTSRNVQYSKLKVTVKDSSGKTYKVRVVDKDPDELEFKILKYRMGKKYSFVIKGVRMKGEKKYGTLKGKVWIPKGSKLKG